LPVLSAQANFVAISVAENLGRHMREFLPLSPRLL
jgi:hypothetical protein